MSGRMSTCTSEDAEARHALTLLATQHGEAMDGFIRKTRPRVPACQNQKQTKQNNKKPAA